MDILFLGAILTANIFLVFSYLERKLDLLFLLNSFSFLLLPFLVRFEYLPLFFFYDEPISNVVRDLILSYSVLLSGVFLICFRTSYFDREEISKKSMAFLNYLYLVPFSIAINQIEYYFLMLILFNYFIPRFNIFSKSKILFLLAIGFIVLDHYKSFLTYGDFVFSAIYFFMLLFVMFKDLDDIDFCNDKDQVLLIFRLIRNIYIPYLFYIQFVNKGLLFNTLLVLCSIVLCLKNIQSLYTNVNIKKNKSLLMLFSFLPLIMNIDIYLFNFIFLGMIFFVVIENSKFVILENSIVKNIAYFFKYILFWLFLFVGFIFIPLRYMSNFNDLLVPFYVLPVLLYQFYFIFSFPRLKHTKSLNKYVFNFFDKSYVPLYESSLFIIFGLIYLSFMSDYSFFSFSSFDSLSIFFLILLIIFPLLIIFKFLNNHLAFRLDMFLRSFFGSFSMFRNRALNFRKFDKPMLFPVKIPNFTLRSYNSSLILFAYVLVFIIFGMFGFLSL